MPVFLKTKLSYEEMDRHVINLIQEGKSNIIDGDVKKIDQGSLLRGLLQANDMPDDGQRLSDRELLSNIYVSEP